MILSCIMVHNWFVNIFLYNQYLNLDIKIYVQNIIYNNYSKTNKTINLFKTIILDKQFYIFLKTQFRYNKVTRLVIIFILVRTQTLIDIRYGPDINLCQDFTQNRNFIIFYI